MKGALEMQQNFDNEKFWVGIKPEKMGGVTYDNLKIRSKEEILEIVQRVQDVDHLLHHMKVEFYDNDKGTIVLDNAADMERIQRIKEKYGSLHPVIPLTTYELGTYSGIMLTLDWLLGHSPYPI